ncbi:MAG TPA: translocation/assembly module TamB domain-containing protein [Thermoanaerobaculia bacterium]|nr:translocation/assembly module TamB domain-containing protein [Thermoanaerobaculia bacterium]
MSDEPTPPDPPVLPPVLPPILEEEDAPSGLPVRRRHGRVRRWVVRPFIWGLLFLVMIVAAAWLLLESGFGHGRAVALVRARTSELLGRQVEIGRVDYSLIDLSFELYDVVIPGPKPGDPAFARIPLARVEFSWRDLRQRVLRLEQIEIVRPHVYLRFNPDGTSNLPELRTRKGGTRRVEVQIGRVLLEGGTLEMDEMRLPLELDARAVFGRAIGQAERGGEGGDRIDAMVTAQEVVTTLPRARPYPFTASVKGSFVPGRIRFNTVRLAGPDLKATGAGSYEWGRGPGQDKPRRLGLEIAADGWAQLFNRLGYVKDPIQGPFEFHGRIDRVEQSLSYSGTVRSPRFAALDRVFEEIEAGLVGGRDGMEIELDRALYAGGNVEGVISVDYNDEEDEEAEGAGTPVDLDLSFARLDLGTVAADQFGEDVPIVQDLAGRATGDLVYRFRTGNPVAGSGLVDVHLDAVHEKGVPIAGDASITIERGVLSSDNIRLTAPSQTVIGSNFLFDMERGSGHFDFRLSSQDVGVLAPLLRGDVRPGEEPPFWVPSEGHGEAEGRFEIADKRFAADIRIDLQDAVSPVIAADDVHGAFRFTPSAVEDLRLEATSNSGALIVTGRVPLEEEGRPRRAPEPLSLAVDAQHWPAPGIVAFLAPGLKDARIDGQVSGRLDLGGTTENLNGRAEIEVESFRIADADLGELQAGIAFQGKQVRIERAVVQAAAGTVLVAGTFDTETKAMDLTVDAPELSLAADPFRDLLGGEVNGLAALTAVIGGTLDRPEGIASLRGNNLVLAGRALGEAGTAQAVATWDGESLTATGSLLGLASFEGGGRLTLEEADLRFDIQSADLGTLIRIASPRAVPEITGSLAGSIGFASDFAQGTWRGELVLSDLRAQYQNHTIANREPVRVELGPESLNIRSLYLGEPGTDNEVFVFGTVGMGQENAPLDLRLQSTVSAVWAELALPPGFDVEGYLDVLAVVRGTTGDPRLDGQGVIRDARLLIPEFPRALEDIEGVVLFNRDELVLDGLRARMGDGVLRAAGSLDLPQPGREGFEYRVQVEADGVSVRFPEPFLLRGDANLSLTGNGSARQIRGQVVLERAFFVEDIQTDALPLLLQALERERLEVVETDELLAGTQIDVQVDGPGALRVRNNVADLRGDIDLRVQGTLAAPVVFGRVEVEQGGTLVYSENEYEVERFLLTFNNPNRIDPIIDLVARTEVRNYDITLNLSGTLDRLDTQFTSDEGLAELEVLTLLFSGELDYEQGRPRAPGVEGPEQDVRAQSFLAGQAASLVSRRVNTLFGFDRFRIDPQATETGGAVGGVRLTVGKRISRDLFVTYTTNPAASEEYLLRIEWQLARNVLLVFTRNGRDETYAVDAEWEKRY